MNERDIFLSALEFEDPAARQAHLESACGDDAELRARVEALLASHESESRFLNTPAVEQMVDDATEEPPATLLAEAGSTEDEQMKTSAANSHGPDTIVQNPNDPEDEIPLGYLQPSSKSDSLGRLAHYEVLEVLGRGAFGTVLKAFDEKLQRVVAIKVLSPEMAVTSPARKRFLREARASAAVRHENVVSIYAVEDEPTPYLVMEYIPGQTLEQRLNEHGPLDLTDVLRLGKQIADGLAAAHDQQLIHRDVKPGNILLDTSVDDHVKITDFGLARTADDATMTQSGVIAGTPMYMAPEQATGQKLDQRADLFSFGSVLYQMLSGRPPFRAPSTVAVLKRVTEDTPRPIQEIIPEVPDWMCEIVGHLHAKDPDARYESAKEVSDLLAQCLADVQAGRTPEIPKPTNAGSDAGVPAPESTPPTKLRRLLQRPLAKVAAAALVLLVGLTITEATGVTKFAATVIRLTTGSGTLVIETDDPSLKIAIDGEEVTIRGAGVEELTLRPGDYQIAAMKDGKRVKQELVTITRDGRTVVRLSLEPGWTVTTSKVSSDAAAQNYALSFDDYDELVELPTLRSQLPHGPLTIEGYVTLGPGEWPADERVNLFMDSSNILVQFQLFESWRFWRATGKSGPGIIANEPPASGVRTHVAAVWDGTRQMLFVNGQRQAVSTNTVQGVSLRETFIPRIGGIGSAARIKELVPYTLDEFRISKVARYSGAFTPTARFEPDEHTLALYHFDEGTGDVLKDSSGNGHDGKIVGAKWVRAEVAPTAPTPYQWPADAPPPAIAPFDAEQAKQHQEEWAKYLGVPMEKRLLLGQVEDGKDVMLDLVFVPPGVFLMGSSDEQIARFREQYRAVGLVQRDFKWLDLEGLQRRVRITRPFYISRTEITNDQFRCFVDAAGFKTEAEASGEGSWTMKDGRMVLDANTNWQTQHGTGHDSPVTHVTWNDANAWCEWLSGREAELAFALPTEAQWEYACRAGTTTAWSCGDDEEVLKDYAIVNMNWYRWCGTKQPNPFGLYDMHGNVWEWCRDSIDNYRDAETVDPVGPDGEKRIIRGGNSFGGFDNGWHNGSGCRSAVRYEAAADHRALDKGYRVVAAISDEVIQAKLSADGSTQNAAGFPTGSSAEIFTSDEYEWSEPQAFGPGGQCWHPSLSKDGLTLVFSSNREGGHGQFDLWMSTRTALDALWSEPKNLGDAINSSTDDVCGRLSADGLSLYFSSDRGMNDEVWVSKRESTDAPWSQAESVHARSEHDHAATTPFVTDDELTLLFGNGDLYTCTRESTSEKWDSPVKLPVVNSAEWEYSPRMAPDGLALIFMRMKEKTFSLWLSVRPTRDASWSRPVPLFPGITENRVEPYYWAEGQALVYRAEQQLFVTRRIKQQASATAE